MAEQSDSRGEETPYNMQHAGNIPEVRSNEEFLQLQKDESETQRSPETFLDGKETFQSGTAGTTSTTTGSSAPITSGMETSTVTSGMPSETANMRSSEPPGQNSGADNPSGGIANESGGVSSTASNKGDDVVTGDTVGTTRVEDDTPARQPETRPPPDTDEKTGEPPADADKGGDKKPSEHKDMGKGGIARENKDAIPTAGGEKLGQKHWGESKMVPDVPKKENEGVASDEGQPDQQTKDNTNANTGDASQDGEEKPGMMDKVKHALHMK